MTRIMMETSYVPPASGHHCNVDIPVNGVCHSSPSDHKSKVHRKTEPRLRPIGHTLQKRVNCEAGKIPTVMRQCATQGILLQLTWEEVELLKCRTLWKEIFGVSETI